MDRFILVSEGDGTTLVIDRELLEVSRVEADSTAAKTLSPVEIVGIPDHRQVSARMYYHQGVLARTAA